MRRIAAVLFLWILLSIPAEATVRWVDFTLSCEVMERALALDMASREQDNPQPWIRILALAAARTGGNPKTEDVAAAYRSLTTGKSPKELLGGADVTYQYYLEAYTAVLGGLVGSYAVRVDGEWKPAYGVKAFSPIAAGYHYVHSDDFGVGRNYGFRRRHLGHDMMGALGTPIVAVERGTVEELGWNQYGGWRIGIRSVDGLRYYYYAHLRKDAPYAEGLREGAVVEAGQVIGFMGRTGYSVKENTDNIKTVHLHFGIQLVLDGRDREQEPEIWIDPYEITRFLDAHRSSVVYNDTIGRWERIYEFLDLDGETAIPG